MKNMNYKVSIAFIFAITIIPAYVLFYKYKCKELQSNEKVQTLNAQAEKANADAAKLNAAITLQKWK